MSEQSRPATADVLLVTLFKAFGANTFRSGPELARALHAASEKHEQFRSFTWNADYRSSKTLNRALNLLDLSGMIVGQNMPDHKFRLTDQAVKNFAEPAYTELPAEYRKAVDAVASMIKNLCA